MPAKTLEPREPDMLERWFIMRTNTETGQRQVVQQGSMITGAPYWDNIHDSSVVALMFETKYLADYFIDVILARSVKGDPGWTQPPGWIMTSQPATLYLQEIKALEVREIPMAALLQAQKVLAEYGHQMMIGDVRRLLQLIPRA